MLRKPIPHLVKFMAAVNEETFQTLVGEAGSRGVSVQALLRGVIIPEWVRESRASKVTEKGVPSRITPFKPGSPNRRF